MGLCASSEASSVPTEVVAVPVEDKLEKDPIKPPEVNYLTVTFVSARGLRDADWIPGAGKSDCFCTLMLDGTGKEVLKTEVMNDTLCPVWKEEGSVDYQPGTALKFTVWDADIGGRRDLLGRVTMEPEQFQKEGFNGEVQLADAGKDKLAYLRLMIKQTGQQYPPGPPPEVTITLEKEPNKPWGLELDTQDHCTLWVTDEVSSGPALKYNQSVTPDLQLKSGDFILRANEAEGDCVKILSVLKKETKLDLTVRRPQEFRILIKRSDTRQPLGLEFPKKLVGKALVVTKDVTSGLFGDWNEANPSRALRQGDRIIAVGNTSGSANDILRTMVKATQFQMIVTRPIQTEEVGI